MIHLLDNPVWSALNSGNQHLALGNNHAKYFQPGIAPFVAVASNLSENYHALWDTFPRDETVAVFTTDPDLDPSPWTITGRIDGYQTMYDGNAPLQHPEPPVSLLRDEHVPAMLELTRLSPPGPFMEKTIRFGGYEGIFSGNLLAGMAGHRFHSGPYVEISAVCTHPEHTGKGYARQLINSQIRQLHSMGQQPYLHVRADNTRAHEIYLKMGFVTRTAMTIYLLKKQ